jgi:hypothetical protein
MPGCDPGTDSALSGEVLRMSFWTNNPHRLTTEAAESLAHSPSGGRLKMWLVGVGVALIPVGYGIHCLMTGQARLPGRYGSSLDTHGSTAVALAVAYMAVGAFLHFHYFWGLHARLHVVSPLLKLLAVIAFLGSFGFAVYRILMT